MGVGMVEGGGGGMMMFVRERENRGKAGWW